MQQEQSFAVTIMDMGAMWEIYRRPRELSYGTTVHEESGKFGLIIEDEKGVLFSTGPATSSLADVQILKKTLLEEVLHTVNVEFRDTKSSTSRIFNRDGKAHECLRYLSRNTIKEILAQQETGQIVQ